MEFTSIKIKKDPLCPLILAKRDSFGEINLSSSQPTFFHVGPLYGEKAPRCSQSPSIEGGVGGGSIT